MDYTAPEQIEEAAVSPRTDVYSLGCVLFEALTGRPPFKRENDLATLWAHMYTAPPPLGEFSPDAPARLDGVVQRALAKDPADRYASAGEVGRGALAALDDGPPAPERAAPPPPPAAGDPPISATAEPHRWGGSRGRSMLVGAAGLLLAAVVAAIVFLGGSDDPGTESSTASPSTSPAAVGIASDWRRKVSLPTARQNMDGAVLDGTIWVIGGLAKSSTASARVEGFDPVINGWKTAPDLPVRLHHPMVVTYKDELVAMGGWIPQGSDQSALVSDRVFALRDGKWTPLPPLRRPRAAGAAAVVGDKIVVAGGQDEGNLVKQTEVFDGEKWSEAARIPTPREHVAAASDGEYLYAVGGRALGPDENFASLERYDPASDSWKRLPDMPTPRGGLGAAIVGGHLIAVGGESPTRALGEVESYNIAREAWSRGPTMRTPRHGLDVEAIGGALYALGGATRPGHASATDTAEVTRLSR